MSGTQTATPAKTPVITHTEYVRVENMLHRLYKDGSSLYAGVFNQNGHTITERVATKLAGMHGTTLESLASEGLTPYPRKRGESVDSTDYGTAHVFEALGY
jgi:hypothetical protein